MPSALESLSQRFDATTAKVEGADTFKDFLLNHAKVRVGGGEYVPYTFKGREGLEEVVETIDLILGTLSGKPLDDARLDICGGAQFGKTILALWLGAFATGILFLNWGYYLPDDNLVEGLVDTKFRPEVVEQLDILVQRIQNGKAATKLGKTVNRKGAFMATDGTRTATGMVRGLKKIPTTFSMDVVMEDEKDDIDAKNAKFLEGRMGSSDQRFSCSIGTQRVHGAGQNKQLQDGSFHVQLFGSRQINLEENWPEVCRLQTGKRRSVHDPKLNNVGEFEGPDGERHGYDPDGVFYFADPQTGEYIDRTKPTWKARQPEKIKQRRWSFRFPRLACDAASIKGIVHQWCTKAVLDAQAMEVFRCDVLADPQSSSQKITPAIVERAQKVAPFKLATVLQRDCMGYGGLDMGDRCWFVAREVESPALKRMRWAEQIAGRDVVTRAAMLFHLLKLRALFIDALPLTTETKALCYKLNGLENITWPRVAEPEKAIINLPGGLQWDGENKRWKNFRCAAVEFTVRQGGGIKHKLGIDPGADGTRFYPVIQCNRFESINRAVNELLTPEENVIDVVVQEDGSREARTEPALLLPESGQPVVDTLLRHIIVGSQRDRDKLTNEEGDFVDGVENHFLLADAYSALAEMEGSGHNAPSIPAPMTFVGAAVSKTRAAFARRRERRLS